MKQIGVKTTQHEQFVNITDLVQQAVSASGVKGGMCFINCAHTTAGLTINENADPDVVHDIILALDTLVPGLRGFRHVEGNSTAHIKSSLMGQSLAVPVHNGMLQLGTWQAVYFCEFDGPRDRHVWVRCIAGE
ncbi:YjbQ family protein [bacterium]|nr:YjbQ family protein [bacterium]